MDPRDEANLLKIAAKWTGEAQAQRLAADRSGREVAAKHHALGAAQALESATQDIYGLVGLTPKASPFRRCLGCQGTGKVPDPTTKTGEATCRSCDGTGSPDIPVDADSDPLADPGRP